MRRRTKQTSIKRRVFLFVGVLLLLSGLVVAVRFHRTEPLIEPEPPELTAKRKSPDNAYYALLELANGLPAPPKPQRVKPGPIAAHMSIRREEDDPEVTEYLKATRATAEKVVEILHEKTYYCPPVTSANSNVKVPPFGGLSRILCGHALYAAKQEESEKATQFVLSGLRLGSAVAKDGPFESVHTGTDIIVQTAICAMCVPWEEYPEEHLRAFLKTLDELRPADIDLSRSLDWEFRLIEAGIYDDEVREDTGGLMASLRETVVRRFLRKHEAELRAVAKFSYPEKEDRSDRHRQLRRTERRVLPTRIVSPLMSSVTSVATASTHVEALRAVVALERYKKTHGEYPESLDALTPEFLGSVPMDAYSTEPLRYSRKKGSYELCSVGRDGNNDNGDPKRDIPFPPASAARFNASLKNAEE